MEEKNVNDIGIYLERKRIRNLKLISTTLIISVVLVFFVCMFKVSFTYGAYSEVSRIDNITTDNYFYKNFDNGIIEYSSNGMSYKKSGDKYVWTYSNSLLKPMISISGNYGVMADLDGNAILPFTTSKLNSTIKSSRKIILVKAVDNGDIIVLTQEGESYYINIYNQAGKNLLEIRSSQITNGIPMDFLVSEDYKSLYVIYLHISGDGSYSNFIDYDISSPGAETDKIKFSKKYDNEVISHLSYLDKNILCLTGAKKIYTYRLDKNMEEHSSTYSEATENVFIRDNAIIQIGNLNNNTFISIYDRNMNVRLYKTIKQVYNKICVSDDEIMFINDDRLSGYKFNGQHIFDMDFDAGIKDVVESGDGSYILTMDGKILKVEPSLF